MNTEEHSPGLPEPAHAEHAVPAVPQLLLIFRRRWRLFAITWVAVVAAVAAYTFTSTRLYRPQATLEIRPETPLVGSETQDASMLASRNLWENYYRTQELILQSPSLHTDVLKALPEAMRTPYDAAVDPIRAFSGQVDIEKVKSSFILKVGFIDPDPQKAVQVVNVLVSLYLEEADRRLKEMKTGAVDALSKETLPATRRRVDEADKALQQFLAQRGFIDPHEAYTTLVESRRTIIGRITQIRLKQIEVRARYETLSGLGSEGLEGIYSPAFYATKTMELLISNLENVDSNLKRAREELKDEHPTVIELRDQQKRIQAKIEQNIQGTLRSLGTDLTAAEKEEKWALDEQARVEKEMESAAQSSAMFKRLDADLTASRELFNTYLRKYGEASATSGSGLGSVRVVDNAVLPTLPFKPNVMGNLGVGGILGIVLGFGLLLLSEQLDDRILSPKEIEAFVGLDVLGVIPKMAAPGGEGKPLLLGDQSTLSDFESFRGLRAEVATRLEGVQGARMVAVLSPMSSEGKSTVASNLAKVLAMDGRKVLLLDADMRKPKMKPHFGEASAPGLEKVLSGEATFESAAFPSRIPGVDVIGMSTGTSQAAELAGSPRFDELIRKARERYEFIVVDSAPVNQASESGLIARRCDAAILVTRERQTGRGSAQAAMKRLRGMGVRVLGAVLNGAQFQAGYGYGYYYSYYGSDKDKEKGRP